jgi:hypothetical protein
MLMVMDNILVPCSFQHSILLQDTVLFLVETIMHSLY